MAKARANEKNPKKKKKGARKHLLSAAAKKAHLKPSHENSNNPNPFDAIWSRRKLHVIGNRRAEGLRVGRSRSLPLHKRNKTLLEEYKRSRKSSVFVDRRIGEGDDALGEFDKSVLRLQRERQMKVKKESKYNLSDDEEDVFRSRISFSKVDDFDEDIPFDEDEEIEPNAKSRKARFLSLQKNSTESNLPDVDENKQKSKKQIYEEIMAKSKFHKALKAKEKEEDEQLLGQLDKDFSSLAQSQALISLTQPTKMNALKALLNRNEKKMSADEGVSSKPMENYVKKEKPDSYDILVKEMALEACARPSDRTKTPEEIAQEEKERLEFLEVERKKRMVASEDSGDESNDDADDGNKISPKITKHVSGDDLGDAIPNDEKPPETKGWADVILEGKNVDDDSDDSATSDGSDNNDVGSSDENGAEVDASADGENDNEDNDDEGEENEEDDDGSGSVPENFLSGKDWEQSDDDLDTDADEMLEDSGQIDRKNNFKNSVVVRDPAFRACKDKPGEQGVAKIGPLPFVIEAPKNMTELCFLLDNRTDTEIIEAVNRILVCNAVKLSAENRKKMQVFYGVLLQYFAVLMGKKPLNLKLINLLVRPLVEMSMDTPYFAAICARERLTRTRKQFVEDVKDPEKSSWPSLKTLILLRLWSLTFPCSDFRHVVMTPATLLMCEYLMRCPISHCRDTAVGSFLCSMLLSVAKQSCKFFPEAIVFLQILLMSAISAKQGLHRVSPAEAFDDVFFKFIQQCYEFLDHRTEKPWLCMCKKASHVQSPDIFMVMELPVDSPFFDSDDFRASVLSSAIETVGGFVNVYDGLSSFPEIFLPVSSLLHELLKQRGIPDSLRARMENTAALIKQKSEEHQIIRHPLQMRKQKPVPLKSINPKFEENYEKGRDYDPDRERVERKKLKKLLKKEAKGAARELRKDNYFLIEAKEKDRMMLEEERAEKYGKIRAFLQEQEHAFKSGQLGKGRKRRR